MSDPYVLEDAPPPTDRRRKRRFSGCLPMLLFVALIAVLIVGLVKYVGVVDDIKGLFSDPEDYAGPGKGRVTFVIEPNESISAMGEELEKLDVVKSQEAFVDAANDNADALGIQAGTYLLKKQMKASDVVAFLVDPGNLAQSTVTIPEGLRVDDIVATLVKNTKFSKKSIETALADTDALGLPPYAKSPEGFLFPATYVVTPQDTAASVLHAMVARWEQAASDNDLEAGADALGYTPEEIMTVASLVEAEGRGRDMAKIARVIYNRIEHPGTAGQIGRLQIDATVDYALGRPLTVGLTQEEREGTQSPYNTFLHQGLPPGPIGNPGDEAIHAALKPARGDWYYYVTVNLKTGETKFASSYEEFQQYQQELRDYCATKSQAC